MTKKIVFFAFFMLSNIYLLSARQSINKSIINLNDAFNKSEPINFIADSTEKEKLEQLSKAWMDAMIRHDTSTLKYLMAPEYKLQRWDGSTPVYLATWLDNLLNHIKIIKFEQFNIYAEIHGDVALVTSLYSWTGTFNNNPFDSKGYLVDTWVRNNNHWQVISRTNGTFAGSKTLDSK
jgi:ketosteroid isomerase-like protein